MLLFYERFFLESFIRFKKLLVSPSFLCFQSISVAVWSTNKVFLNCPQTYNAPAELIILVLCKPSLKDHFLYTEHTLSVVCVMLAPNHPHNHLQADTRRGLADDSSCDNFFRPLNSTSFLHQKKNTASLFTINVPLFDCDLEIQLSVHQQQKQFHVVPSSLSSLHFVTFCLSLVCDP